MAFLKKICLFLRFSNKLQIFLSIFLHSPISDIRIINSKILVVKYFGQVGTVHIGC